LKEAYSKIEAMVTTINEHKRESEGLQKVIELSQQLIGAEVIKLYYFYEIRVVIASFFSAFI
jgi:hypothetical protein